MSKKLSAARAVADLNAGSILAVVEIEASPERVFDALTTAEVAKWWGQDGMYHVTAWSAELRPGGTWMSTGTSADGSTFSVGGKILEVERPRLFAHTWEPAWDGGNVTTVRYQLAAIPGGTRVTLRHDGFAGRAESCESHATGWERVMGWLTAHVTGGAKKALKAVLQYDVGADAMPRAIQHYPAHKARLDAFHARGDLLLVGRFENPLDGAMAVFANRTAAEEFMREDPFMLHGVVARATLRGWDEIFA